MSTRINFVTKESPVVDGFHNVNINNEMTSVINGSVQHILCEQLDDIPIQIRNHALSEILNKLAFDGEATFKFINATVLANRIIKNEIDCTKISGYIQSIKSLWTEYYILEIFNSIPNIVTNKYYLDNVHSVISVSKKV